MLSVPRKTTIRMRGTSLPRTISGAPRLKKVDQQKTYNLPEQNKKLLPVIPKIKPNQRITVDNCRTESLVPVPAKRKLFKY